MGTTTKPGARSPCASSPSASVAPLARSSTSRTSSAPTTTSSVPRSTDVIPRPATSDRICPSCGLKKYRTAETCRQCYSPAPQKRSSGKVCPGCGGKKAGHAAVCRKCRVAALPAAPLVELACEHCGTPFERKRSEHVAAQRKYGAQRVFCSRTCYEAHPKPPAVAHGICGGCGAPLTRYEQKKYCSHGCYLKHRPRKQEAYGGEYVALKKLLLAQKDRKCALCAQKTYRVDVHHIDHDAENSAAKNLVLLCSRCHRSYHTFTASAQEILKSVFRAQTARL